LLEYDLDLSLAEGAICVVVLHIVAFVYKIIAQIPCYNSILQQGLPAMGVVQNFPWALAHGQLDHQGLNIPNLFTEQTIVAHIKTLLTYHDQPDDPTGILLWVTGKAFWLETGLTGPLFEAPTLLHKFITDS